MRRALVGPKLKERGARLSLAHAPALLLLTCLLPPVAFAAQTDEALLETGRASRLRQPPANPTEIKVISYNIRWREGEELRKIIELLKTDAALGHAALIGLQEVDRNKGRTHHTNTARELAEALGMYYAWAAPPAPPAKGKAQEMEEETGVEILSPYPLTEVRRIVLPVEGPSGRRRVALGATVKIGPSTLRFYSVHAETRISVEQKTEQLRAVLADMAQHTQAQPAIVLGDFNTWQPNAAREVKQLFTRAGFTTPFPAEQATFYRNILIGVIEIKLDWMWLRGVRPLRFGIARKVEISDHWPLWADVKL
jgi:endonuclease/exonuclease/phosphatase family metal-dependent hydrolase